MICKKNGARNIYISRSYDGTLQVKYLIKVAVQEKKLERELQRNGARMINVRKSFDGSLNVQYSIKCANPQKDIELLLTKSGGKNVHSISSYNGARFDFRLDDIIDERVFKKQVIEILRKSGYKSY